jgi:sugar lactone lactonase YvrE
MSRLVVLCVLVFTAVEACAQLAISTLAGSRAGGGWDDGPIATARLMGPVQTVVNRAGDVFVLDATNQNIRRIGRDGQVSTFAGYVATEDVPYGTPSFIDARAIAIDADDILYVSDSGADVVYRITPAGVRTKLATVTSPRGLAVDKNGNVFVVVGDTIRMVKPSGDVSLWAGGTTGYADGPRLSAKFNLPLALTLDSDGTMYVTDGLNDVVRKIAPDGMVTTFAGTANRSGDTDGAPGTARFAAFMSGITVDPAGNLYVVDTNNAVLRRVAPDGTTTTVAGRTYKYSYRDGTNNENGFVGIAGTMFDRLSNSVLVADEGGAVRRYDPATTALTTFAGSEPTPAFADGPASSARFNTPWVAVDDAQGNIYVAERYDIRKIASSGEVTTIAGGSVSGSSDGTGQAAGFKLAHALAMGSDGNLYVGDYSAIRRVTPSGVVTTIAGDPNTVGYADAKGLDARFYYIAGIAFDNTGNLLIADAFNHRIRKLDSSGNVTTVAGSDEGYVDGPAATAQFLFPVDVDVDMLGSIYVADDLVGDGAVRKIANGNVTTLVPDLGDADSIAVSPEGRPYVSSRSRIARIESNGSLTAVAGVEFVSGNVDGVGRSARLGDEGRIRFDRNGRLLIADTYNYDIRVGTVTKPAVKRFEATSYVVSPSAPTTTLTWYTTGLSVSIDGVGVNLPPAGSMGVNVSSTTTFHLTARGDGGTATSQLTVFVGQLQHRRPTHH